MYFSFDGLRQGSLILSSLLNPYLIPHQIQITGHCIRFMHTNKYTYDLIYFKPNNLKSQSSQIYDIKSSRNKRNYYGLFFYHIKHFNQIKCNFPITQLDNIYIILDIPAQMRKGIIEKLQQLLPNKHYQIDVYDKLLMTSFPYYLLALIIISGIFTMEKHAFVFIVIIYSILPVLDEVLSMDWRNPTVEERLKLEQNNFLYKAVLYLTVIVDWLLFFKMMNLFANYEFTPYNTLNFMGIIYIFSNLESAQFAVAHEIFHKQNVYDRFFGTLHMSKLLYMHFTYEHIWGHHKKVATPEDPASAQKGMTVYQFIARSFIGSYKSVYNMQAQAKKPIYLNNAVLSVLGAMVFSYLIFRVYGTQAFVLYLITAFGAISYLEGINYLEHYGLRRTKNQNGQYQKVTIKHSWNAPHRISNYLLFKLQRHSDHHQNCLKPYQTLISLEDSPQLSHGYSLTIIMAFFPSVWFSVMDPLVDEYNKTKTGNFDGQVRQRANKLIRYFILELSLASVLICLTNYAILYLGELQTQKIIV